MSNLKKKKKNKYQCLLFNNTKFLKIKLNLGKTNFNLQTTKMMKSKIKMKMKKYHYFLKFLVLIEMDYLRQDLIKK